MKSKIEKLIDNYEDIAHFSYVSPSDEMIMEAEKELMVKIPEDYKWFLKKYGEGGLDGIHIFGINRLNKMTFVRETLEHRKYGMPKQLIAIENCDEWMYCINSKDGSIVMWFQDDDDIADKSFNNFYELLLDEINDVIENLDS